MTTDERPEAPRFAGLPDLASRALAGSVVHANDELFAQRENLIMPGPPEYSPDSFGHRGKVYDGWETRRRREPGHDHAVVRLGVAGIIRGVVIDTSWFTGNYPPNASVEATSLEGYPSVADLEAADWVTLVATCDIAGDAQNAFQVTDGRRFTHVRLSIYPDGGVARFRVHGEPFPDPRLLTGTVDLAALEHGGSVVDCSNWFYSSPTQLLHPGRARSMGEGWENARRRDGGNDHVTIRLAGRGRIRRVELDTSYFVGNAPGEVVLRGLDPDRGDIAAPETWVELLPRTRVQPDTRHFFRIGDATPVTHVRLDVYPDGGLARLRVHGELTGEALADATVRWIDVLPTDHALAVLIDAGQSRQEAEDLLARRPLAGAETLPAALLASLLNG